MRRGMGALEPWARPLQIVGSLGLLIGSPGAGVYTPRAVAGCLGIPGPVPGEHQPLLTEMIRTYPLVLEQIFNAHYPELQATLGADREEQLAWARSIQAPPWRHLMEPWQGYFKTLGRRPECQDLE